MTTHFCEYDHQLDEPCGAPASIRCTGMWMCAEHYDQHARFMATFGMTPESPDRESLALPDDEGF